MKIYRVLSYLNGTFYQEPTLSELQAAWTGSQTVMEDKENYYPVWEYYGRHHSFGATPAVTNLAGPVHRAFIFTHHLFVFKYIMYSPLFSVVASC